MTALYVPGVEETDLKKVIRSLQNIATVNTPGQRLGINSNTAATAGNLGEVIESTVLIGAALPATSNISLDITSLSLTPGNWQAWGLVATIPAAGTTTSYFSGWISTTSATLPTVPNGGAYTENRAALGAGLPNIINIGQKHLSVAATTTVYLSSLVAFATSTMAVYGYIGAYRVS